MITPSNDIPANDAQASEADDQQSQKDIHDNGFDQTYDDAEVEQASPEMLRQAYDAAEPSYTLKLDEESKTEEPKNGDEE